MQCNKSQMFTDESRFSLEYDTLRVLVWRERSTRNEVRTWKIAVQRRQIGGVGAETARWMYWPTSYQKDTLVSQRYADMIPGLLVVPYATETVFFFILIHDNARHHTARHVEVDMFETETMRHMKWSICSDLNLIQHIWDKPEWRISARPVLPLTVRDLNII